MHTLLILELSPQIQILWEGRDVFCLMPKNFPTTQQLELLPLVVRASSHPALDITPHPTRAPPIPRLPDSYGAEAGPLTLLAWLPS